jgi:hypothetical protein
MRVRQSKGYRSRGIRCARVHRSHVSKYAAVLILVLTACDSDTPNETSTTAEQDAGNGAVEASAKNNKESGAANGSGGSSSVARGGGGAMVTAGNAETPNASSGTGKQNGGKGATGAGGSGAAAQPSNCPSGTQCAAPTEALVCTLPDNSLPTCDDQKPCRFGQCLQYNGQGYCVQSCGPTVIATLSDLMYEPIISGILSSSMKC